MTNRTLLLLLLTCIMASCVAGEDSAAPEGNEAPTECTSDLNCGEGYYCKQGSCRLVEGESSSVGDTTSSGGDAGALPVYAEGCVATLDCVQSTCADGDLVCWELCGNKLETASNPLWMTYLGCVAAECVACADYSCWESCSIEKCARAWVSCVSDGASSEGSCAEGSSCHDGCSSWDYPCLNGCFSSITAAAQSDLGGWIQCGAQGDSADLDLAAQLACYDAEVTCLCPEEVAGSGEGGCGDYWTCIDGCSDSCCVAGCRADMSDAAVSAADGMALCMAEPCGDCPEGDAACVSQCALENCGSEVAQCYCPDAAEPGSGSGKCGAALQCVQGCVDDGACCVAECAAATNPASYEKLLALLDCLPSCGCGEGDEACYGKCFTPVIGACASEALACTVD